MLLTRRSFHVLSILAAAGLTLPARAGRARNRQSGERSLFQWSQPCDSVRVAQEFGGNAMVVSGKDAAALIDTKLTGFGGSLRRSVVSDSPPLAMVINTHHHADHTGGNYAFSTDVEVAALQQCRDRCVRQFDLYANKARGALALVGDSSESHVQAARDDILALLEAFESMRPEAFAPTRLIRDGEEISIGGVRIVLRHVGPGHTDNDVFVHLPDLNVLHTGDLVFNSLHPYVDREAGATSDGWIKSCRAMADLCDEKTIVVPGHGSIGDVGIITSQIAYFEVVRTQVAQAIRDGVSLKDVGDQPIAGYDSYGMDQFRPIALRAVYQELAPSKD